MTDTTDTTGEASDDDRPGDTPENGPDRIAVDDIDGPVLLFDGVCNLCHAGIRTIVRLDAAGKIRFAPLQSDVGQALLAHHDMPTDYFDSMVLVEDGEYYTKSTAVLRVCRYLDGPLPLLYPLVSLPERARDAVYDLVAEHRYQVFGRKDQCSLPDERVRQRFQERMLA